LRGRTHSRLTEREPGVDGRLRVVYSGCVRLGREALACAKGALGHECCNHAKGEAPGRHGRGRHAKREAPGRHGRGRSPPRQSDSPRVEANTGS